MLQAKATFLRLEESLNNIINTLGKYKVVNEKNAVVESPKLNLTLAKAETKDMNYSELCRLFMWKLNYGIRKGCTANDSVEFLFIFVGNWLLWLSMVKKLCFFMMMNLCLRRRLVVSLEMPDSIQKQLIIYFVPFYFHEKVLHFPSNTFLKILNVWLLPFMQMPIYFSTIIALKVFYL